ncbi:MAG: biotin--[acetyl-CoA-carboxylase] ligase [Verrucomicrobia bacterium]|jgi:BirA family biotin operon repressor/biotin-[acetyl-CoA-carboxylase] ligase|nr:biotin--[acetyl-CoA-carboxylase] ligase [Verrucomicrobiota bacterium]
MATPVGTSLDAAILSALRQREDQPVSGADLARQLGVTRAAVWARIQELRRLGYDIAASPHEGYRLRDTPDLLHADDLMAQLGATAAIGRQIQVFRSTTSTNDVVDKLGRDGVAEGVVVFAEAQTSGRGRLGRRWVSPAGKGLWFSVLLRPTFLPQEATRLTVAAATAIARAVRIESGVAPEIKWPNDLLVRGRKLAGVLTEMNAELDRIHHVVLGIGLNANQTGRDFPTDLQKLATSLRLETGRSVRRADLAVAILRELDRDYARVCAGDFEALADEWESLCTTLGRQVTIVVGERRIHGRAEALDAEGALLVRTEFGRLERVTGGDVTLSA